MRTVDSVGNRTLDSVLDAAVTAWGDRVLFETVDDGTTTYAQFAEHRDRLAARLSAQSVGTDSVVLVRLNTSVAAAATLFAIYRIGAVAAMANPALTARELTSVAERSGATHILSDDVVPDTLAHLVPLDVTALGTAGGPTSAGRITPDSPSTILFTSGTTATPKAVRYQHGHQVLAADSYAATLLLTSSSTLMHHFPVFHMNGMCQLFAAITAGSRVVLLERFRSGLFDGYVDRFRPTTTFLNATHIKMLRQVDAPLARPSSLTVVGTSLHMDVSDYDWFESKYGCLLREGYGQTESVTMCLANPVGAAKRNSCGLPLPGYEARVVDPDTGADCMDGTPGELLLRGTSRFAIMDGYLGDAESTATALDGGWLHTGDIVRTDADGYFFYVDRAKDIIKRAGENIAASEVESVLHAIEGVHEAAVVGRPDQLREQVPVAFVVAADGYALEPESLREMCRSELAAYKIPETIYIITEMPRNAVGKIDKLSLKRTFEETTA